MTDTRRALAPIKKLLFTRDAATVAQGVELLRALGDPALFYIALAGTTWSCAPTVEGQSAPYGSLTPGPFCRGAASTGHWDLMLALALLAAAPPECKVASELLASATSLALDRSDYRSPLPLDLAPLRAFTHLERLLVRNGHAIVDLAALASLPKLAELRLEGPVTDLGPLSGAPALRQISVHSSALHTPSPMREMPALRELDLSGCQHLVDLEFLRPLDALERLDVALYHARGDLSPLADLSSLKGLCLRGGNTVTSVDTLARCTALEDLFLYQFREITTLAPLRTLPRLRTLRLETCEKLQSLDLEGAPSLEVLTLRWVPVRDIDCLAHRPFVEVDINCAGELEGLGGLRATRSVQRLSLHSQKLRSFEGVEGCVDLEFVGLRLATSLTSVRALSHAAKLTTLLLPKCFGLTSLDGLEGCTSLTHCELTEGPFSDLTPLSNLHALERLNLRGCANVTDVTALAALPNLRALVLTGTGVDRATLPAKLRHITSFAQDASLDALAAKPPPAPRGPVVPTAIPAEHRKAWTRLKKLLLSRDVEMIDQGVELVRALEDPTLYEQLLAGVHWTPPDRHAPCGTLATKGSYFEDTEPARAFRTRAILALAAAAPDACDAARGLREGLKMLWFEGHTDAKRPAPFDVAPLAKFTALERLDIVHATEITHPEALAEVRALKSLAIRSSGPCALPDLSAHPSLESVSLHDFDVADASRALSAPSLVRASFSALKGESALRVSNHPKLQSLQVSSSQGLETVSLVGCAALIDLQVSWTQALERLDVTGCTGLRQLALHMCPKLSSLRGFETLTALTRFNGSSLPPACLPRAPLDHLTQLGEVEFNTSTLTDCEALTIFTHATSMTLSSSKHLRDVSALARLTRLRALSIQWCAQVTDVTSLEGLPLHTLKIHGSGVVPASVPLALKRAVK